MASKRKAKRKSQQMSLGRRVMYWGSHLLCGCVVILIFLTMVQCTIKKPEAPTWQTNLVVPLANKTWTMSELIDKIDQENLTVDGEGNPIFYYHDILDTVTISGSFAVDNVSQSVAESLGIVTLAPVTATSFTVSLADEFPSLPAGTFPDTNFTISQPLPVIGDYSTATVASGQAVITIANDFGLNLDTVVVTISDMLLGRQVSSYSIPGGLPAGSASSDTVDLAGQTVSNQLTAVIYCHALQQTSFSLSGKSLSTSVGMPGGLSVSSATAKIPQVERAFSENLSLSGEHQLQSAVLADGRLVLDLYNNTNVPATLTISLPDIYQSGTPLIIAQPVNAHQSGQYIYDLTGSTVEPLDQVMPQDLRVNINAVIASSGDQLVTISAGDQMSVTAAVENLSLGSVSGIIAATTADFVDITQSIDIPTGFDEMQLPSAVLVLEIENTVNIPGSFSVTVDGDAGQHKVISGAIAPGTPEIPVVTVITDSNLTAFMNPIPETFTVSGSATFGDGVTSGSINPNDYVIAAITLSSPLEMIIDESTFDGEWEGSNLDIDSSVVNSLNVANFYATFVNHLPVGVTAEILFGNDSATLYSNPAVVLGPVTVSPGLLNPDGSVAEAVTSETILSMDADEAQVLHGDTLWVGELVTLHGTDGESVTMSATDYLTITGYIEIDFTFGEQLWED